MSRMKKPPSPEKQAQLIAEFYRNLSARQQTYRESALRMFPHFCGRCGREFTAENLRELTVHHKDGNHMNNPSDGSNWELLCLYCHDNEHESLERRGQYEGAPTEGITKPTLGFKAFEGLKDLVIPQNEPSEDA